MFAAFTGLRAGDLAGLNIGDLTLPHVPGFGGICQRDAYAAGGARRLGDLYAEVGEAAQGGADRCVAGRRSTRLPRETITGTRPNVARLRSERADDSRSLRHD
jgi:hypothetical protein